MPGPCATGSTQGKTVTIISSTPSVKFGAATYGQTGKMLAEVVARAARGNVLYVELLLTPDGVASSQIGQKVGWDGNFENTLRNLRANGIADAHDGRHQRPGRRRNGKRISAQVAERPKPMPAAR